MPNYVLLSKHVLTQNLLTFYYLLQMRYFAISLGIVLLQSCVTHDELINFTEATFPLDSAAAIANQIDLKVQPLDLLQITVSSFDPLAAAPFNPQVNPDNAQQSMNPQIITPQSGAGVFPLELLQGYFVDGMGMVDFPVLGKLAVAGKTLDEIKQDIYTRLQPYLQDAAVNIRFLNFKVSVMGEVKLPGVLRSSNPRMTILEAISLAGDLTPYANRTNVLLVREIDGQRTYTRIDLRRRDFFDSPYFYLRQNDFIYVEPIQAKVATVADPAQRFIAYSSGVLSIITLILALTR